VGAGKQILKKEIAVMAVETVGTVETVETVGRRKQIQMKFWKYRSTS
jgi:hypothetical protein